LNLAGKTVIYTTHIMAEAETMCQRVAIVDHGQVLALGTVGELKTSLGREEVIHIEGVISAEASRAVQSLAGVTQAVRAAVDGRTQLTVVVRNQQGLLPRLIETLTAHEAVIQKIMPEEITLEDVFITRTGRTLADDTRVK
jgi:ABC-2 type transport system ATP-binding protein